MTYPGADVYPGETLYPGEGPPPVLLELAGVITAAAAVHGQLHVVTPPRRLPDPGPPLPPATSGWRADPPSTYRPPTVVYLDG